MPTPRLRFTSRTAQQIREDLIRMIPDLAPSWTSHGEDEPGIALVDMLSGVADGLHYYLDKQALETFLPSVRLRKNAMSLSHLIGYRPRRTLAAQGTIRAITTQPLSSEIFIPANTQFRTQGGLFIVSAQPMLLPAGFSGIRTVNAVQGELLSFTAESPGGREMDIRLPHDDPSEQLFRVSTYDQPWVEFRDSQPEDPDNRWYHYFEDLDGNVYLQFRGDLGNVPMAGTPVRVDYLRSQDIKISSATPLGRPDVAHPDTLTSAEIEAFNLSLDRLEFETGVLQGYRVKERINRLRFSAPLSIKTKNRAVSENDYRFLARQVGGVKDLRVLPSDFYTRQVVAYVLMEDGEEPTQETLDTLQAYLDDRNDLTLDLVTEPAILQPFRCAIDVKAAPGYTEAVAVFQAREELLKFLRTTANNFGRTVRISEIYNRANQPDSVEYVNLIALHWDDEPTSVADLVPASEVHVPTIGDRLAVSPVIE